MQIHLRQVQSGYTLIQEGMYLTVGLIWCMSLLLENLFRCLNLSFEEQNTSSHSQNYLESL